MLLELNIDLWTDYIPFERQATKVDGEKVDPSAAVVRIYEESGADATFDNSEITGSPFTCAKINGKTGNFGVLVDKSLFTVGKIYRVLFEWTVDGKDTADEVNYLIKQSSDFKASVSSLETGILAIVNKLPTNYIMGSSDQVDKDPENFNMSAETA